MKLTAIEPGRYGARSGRLDITVMRQGRGRTMSWEWTVRDAGAVIATGTAATKAEAHASAVHAMSHYRRATA